MLRSYGLWGIQFGDVNLGWGDPNYAFGADMDWSGYWGDVGDTLGGEAKGAGAELSLGLYKPCYMLRTFLSSYFLPNYGRKNPEICANAVVETDAVVLLADAATGRSRVLRWPSDPIGNLGRTAKRPKSAS